jgi:hypothetical protein
MTKLSKLAINIVIFVISITIGLVVCEFAARLVLNPSDFLALEMVSDPILGWVPSRSAMASCDKWGFRNRTVPESSDIVAVGDSHTYGNTARMIDSWPYVLGELTGRQVYSMALGGYGPNQYFYLTKAKALSLKPRMIIWGLYMGDDFEGAYSLTYGREYWAYLRVLPAQDVGPDAWEPPESNTRIKRVRVWLSQHSVIYQLVFHSGFGGRVAGEAAIRNAPQISPGMATSLVIPEKGILEAFRPRGVLARLDLDDPKVREGMRVTFELLQETQELCEQNHIQFLVVVIPTKELVFSDYLEHNSNLPLDDLMDKLLVYEREAESETFRFMSDNHIAYVDPLPLMKKSIGEGLYARSAGDMHPNKNGYRVIGQAVAEYLKGGETGNPPAAVAR